MRVVFALVGMLLCLPTQAPAEIIKIFYLNSNVLFGLGDGSYRGRDREDPREVDETILPDTFFASLGPLVEQELLKDQNGVVVQSNYFYSDGRFDFGTFMLPITSFGIWAPDPGFRQIESGPLVGERGGDVYFTFGAGLLDAGLANALGTSRHIVGGEGAADMIMAPNDRGCAPGGPYGDHLSLHREACDGALWIELEVPEPTHLSLVGAGLAWLIARRRRRP